MEYELVLSTRSVDAIEEIKQLKDVHVEVQKNLTGETLLILLISPAVVVATIQLIDNFIQSRNKSKDVAVKSHAVKFGNGSVEIKGFDLTDTIEIIDKLSTVRLSPKKPKT